MPTKLIKKNIFVFYNFDSGDVEKFTSYEYPAISFPFMCINKADDSITYIKLDDIHRVEIRNMLK